LAPSISDIDLRSRASAKQKGFLPGETGSSGSDRHYTAKWFNRALVLFQSPGPDEALGLVNGPVKLSVQLKVLLRFWFLLKIWS
jgi:hypothetical protein